MTKKENHEKSSTIDKSKKKEKKLSKDDLIKKYEEEISELKLEVLRTRADFENYRKRKDKETIDARDRGICSFVEDILPAIDNFEMSLKMTDNTKMFQKGVEMIHKNLLDTLTSHKIEEFGANPGDEFDPKMHDPILIESSEVEPGKIHGVIKKGFKKGDKILRHAKVQVVKEN